jgi:hypothetical protein
LFRYYESLICVYLNDGAQSDGTQFLLPLQALLHAPTIKDLDELRISGELEGDNARAEKSLLVLKQ